MHTNTIFPPETEAVIAEFGFQTDICSLENLGQGNINQTFLLTDPEKGKFVLQKINTAVFKNPQQIVENWLLAQQHLLKKAPHYRFLNYHKTVNGKWLAPEAENPCWRLISYFENTQSIETATSPVLAAKTAAAFALFTELLQDIDSNAFNTILPGFHDLGLRQQQFDTALQNASAERQEMAQNTMAQLQNCKWMTEHYRSIVGLLPQRVMHMDAKISNVLFDERSHEVACIIDLDTLMTGTILSDLGDMIRSMVCPIGENETDLSKIKVNSEMLHALVSTYTSQLKSITEDEKKHAPFSGLMLVYMQALRFASDFLQNDTYYTIQYPLHNLHRAENQTCLLLQLLKEPMYDLYLKQNAIPSMKFL